MPVNHPLKAPGDQIELIKAPGLLTPSRSYRPLRYPWAIDFWRRQQQIHWMPEEIPLGEDCKDWSTRLSDAERNLLFVRGAIPGSRNGIVTVAKQGGKSRHD